MAPTAFNSRMTKFDDFLLVVFDYYLALGVRMQVHQFLDELSTHALLYSQPHTMRRIFSDLLQL